ncbi:hypothetical protein BH11PAT1_BH11PAT1_5530 [soil metagenome]
MYITLNIGQFLLIFHLLGAVCIALLMLTSFFALAKHKSSYYKPLAIHVAVTTCFQLITGSLLALTYPNSESIFSFCSKIGIYLVTVILVESLLFKRLYTDTLFPIKLVISSLTLGFVFVFVTILHL